MLLQAVQGRWCLFQAEGQALSQLCRVRALCHHPGDTALAGREQGTPEGAQVCPWCVPGTGMSPPPRAASWLAARGGTPFTRGQRGSGEALAAALCAHCPSLGTGRDAARRRSHRQPHPFHHWGGQVIAGLLAWLQNLVEKLKQADCGVSHFVSVMRGRVVKPANKTWEKSGLDTNTDVWLRRKRSAASGRRSRGWHTFARCQT